MRHSTALFSLVIAMTGCGADKDGASSDADPPSRDAAGIDGSRPRDDSGVGLDAASPPPPPGDATTPPPPPGDAGTPPPPPPDDAGPTGDDMGIVPPTDAGPSPTGAEALAGYWVWKQTIEGGAVTLEITEEDLMWRVGPTGWDGCPAGISCTNHGIHSVAFALDSDRAHYSHRVVTGSDTQHPARYRVEGDLLVFERTERFSCAHPPGGSAADAGTFYARFRRMGDDLWLSVAGFGGLPLSSEMPPAEPDRWIVYRPISQADFHGRYDHPYCGAARKMVDSCHPLCDSPSVLTD